MLELVLRKSHVNPERPYALALRYWDGYDQPDYYTLARVGPDVARDIIEAGHVREQMSFDEKEPLIERLPEQIRTYELKKRLEDIKKIVDGEYTDEEVRAKIRNLEDLRTLSVAPKSKARLDRNGEGIETSLKFETDDTTMEEVVESLDRIKAPKMSESRRPLKTYERIERLSDRLLPMARFEIGCDVTTQKGLVGKVVSSFFNEDEIFYTVRHEIKSGSFLFTVQEEDHLKMFDGKEKEEDDD